MKTIERAIFGLVYIFIINILLVYAYKVMELNIWEEMTFFFVYLVVAIIAVFPALDIIQYGFYKNYVGNFIKRCFYIIWVISLGIFVWGRTDELQRIYGFICVTILIAICFYEAKGSEF